MKLKTTILILISISIFTCNKQRNEILYAKDNLTIDDCKNIHFATWILRRESGLDLGHEKIKIVITDYFGGLPVEITQLPIFYELAISEQEYNNYKLRFSNKFSGWRFFKNSECINFVLVNKHELSCIIEKNKIIFGLRNVDVIAP